MIQREASKRVKLAQLDIPAGTQIFIPITAIHQDTDVWGADAHEFNPSRFINSRRHLASYFPLGLGPRICVGQNLAIVELKIVLAMIISHYSFTLSPTYVHAPTLLVTLQPQYGAQLLMRRVSS